VVLETAKNDVFLLINNFYLFHLGQDNNKIVVAYSFIHYWCSQKCR